MNVPAPWQVEKANIQVNMSHTYTEAKQVFGQ